MAIYARMPFELLYAAPWWYSDYIITRWIKSQTQLKLMKAQKSDQPVEMCINMILIQS